MRMRLATALIATLLACGCPGAPTEPVPATPAEPPAPTPTAEESPVPDPPWSLTYADGSGNATRLWQDGEGAHFEYTPVTPEMSSSGVYSGGDPRSGALEPAQIDELWRLAREVQATTSAHIEARIMGSSQFSLTTPTEKASFKVSGCEQLAAFQGFITSLTAGDAAPAGPAPGPAPTR